MNFDIFAKDYRDIHDENLKKTGYLSSYFSQRKVLEILKHIKLKNQGAGLKILDLGCGDGLVSSYFRKYFPQAFICGIDVSPDSINECQLKQLGNCEFKVYDGRNIPYPGSFFDIILAANILHHIRDNESRVSLLKECHRTLKKGGLLFIFEHNPLNFITKRIVTDCVFDKDAKLLTHFTLKHLLKSSGFLSRFSFIIFFPGCIKKMVFLEKFIWWLPLGGQYYSISQKLCKRKN